MYPTQLIMVMLNVKGLINTRGPGISSLIKLRQEMKKHGVVQEDQATPPVPNVVTIIALIQQNVVNFTTTIGASITPPRPNAKTERVSPTAEKPIGALSIRKDLYMIPNVKLYVINVPMMSMSSVKMLL